MNKLPFIFLVFFLIINTGIHGQLGIYTGCNFSKIPGYYYPSTLEARPLIRLTGGVYYENDLNRQLLVRWGLMYSPKGFVLKREEFFQRRLFNYIEMPVTVKYSNGPFYVHGGIYLAWAVNGILKTGDGDELFSERINFEVEEIRQLDFGLRAGAGVQFKTGNMKLFLQADYSQGIQNLNKGAGNPARNSVAGISTGIILNLRKIISISHI